MNMFLAVFCALVAFWAIPDIPLWLDVTAFFLLGSLGLTANGLEKEADRDVTLAKLSLSRREGGYHRVIRRYLARFQRIARPKNAVDHPKPKGLALFWRVTPLAKDRIAAQRTARTAFGWTILDVALRVAFVYPVFLATLQWAYYGDPVFLGGFEAFPEERRAWPRLLISLPITLVILPRLYLALPFPRTAKDVVGQVLPFLNVIVATLAAPLMFAGAIAGAGAAIIAPAVVVALAAALAVTFAAPFAVAGASAFAVAGASAFAVAGASAFAVAFAVGAVFAGVGVPAFACAVAVAVATLVRRGRPAIGYALLILFAYVSLIGALIIAPFDGATPNQPVLSFTLFLGLLPLTNALFDFLSYGATLALIRWGLAGGTVRRILLSLCDIFLALILFIALGASLIAVISLANLAAGQSVFELAPLFDAAERREVPAWVILMLFSTALPTGLHLFVAGASCIAFAPAPWRDYIAAQVKQAGISGKAKFRATLALGLTFLLAGVLPLAFFALVGYVLHLNFPLLVDTYLQAMRLVAVFFGQIDSIGPGYLPQSLAPVTEV